MRFNTKRRIAKTVGVLSIFLLTGLAGPVHGQDAGVPRDVVDRIMPERRVDPGLHGPRDRRLAGARSAVQQDHLPGHDPC